LIREGCTQRPITCCVLVWSTKNYLQYCKLQCAGGCG